MNVINRIVNKQEFFPFLVALLLSTLLIGYAPSSIVLGILFVASCYSAIINKKEIKFDGFLILPISLYLLLCLSIFWTVDVSNTIKGISRMSALLIIPFLFGIIPKFSWKQYNYILKWFTFSNALYGLFFLLIAGFKFINTTDFKVFTYHDLVEVLDLNAIYVSSFFIISIFYLLGKKNKTILEKAVFLFLVILLFLLASKMIIIVLFVGVIIYGIPFSLLKQRKSLKNILILTLILFVIGLSSLHVLNRFYSEKSAKLNEVIYNEKFSKIYPWTGTSFRLLQLRILSDQIKEEDIIWRGFGLFASRNNLKERHLAFNTYYGYHTYNYHNMYAQILAEAGIFGLLIIITMLLFSAIKAIRAKELVFIMFCLLFIMVFITESYLWVHRGLFFFLTMYCLFNRSVIGNLKTQ